MPGAEETSPVRAAVAATVPRVAASHGLPLARPLRLRVPGDSWVCGQNLAQDTRWAADGNRLMSTPTSAMISYAAVGPAPVICANCCAW